MVFSKKKLDRKFTLAGFWWVSGCKIIDEPQIMLFCMEFIYIFSFLVNERFNTVKLEDPTKIGQNETPSAGKNSNDVTVAKGEIISEGNCGILDFQKKFDKFVP